MNTATSDSSSQHDADEWWAPIQARVQPEFGELVNVGAVFGNGRLSYLEIQPGLRRLAGLTTAGHRAMLEHILIDCQRRLRGIESEARLREAMGLHFTLGSRRRLLMTPSGRIRRILLSTATDGGETHRQAEASLTSQSTQLLDAVRVQLDMGGVDYIEKRTAFKALYPAAIEVTRLTKIPRVERMLRGFNRDVILGSLVIEPQTNFRAGQERVSKISAQMRAVEQLKPFVHSRLRRDVRGVAVLFVSPSDLTADDELLADIAERTLKQMSPTFMQVSTVEQAVEYLQDAVEWARGKT